MKNSYSLIRMSFLLCCLFTANSSYGHHSVAGFYTLDEFIEIEGTVTAAKWRNPHTAFNVDVTDESGETRAWVVETGALSVLRARGLDRAFLKVGDKIKVMGNKSRRSRPEVFARNMLLASGSEVLLTVESNPYFVGSGLVEVLEAEYDEVKEAAARRNAEGIFRVWSSDFSQKPFSGATMFHGDYPMNDEARVAQSQWDPGDPSLLGCFEWPMPYLMYNPLPIEFIKQGQDILIRFEEDDNERLVQMSPDARLNSSENRLLGVSRGHWDGTTLVVETSNIKANVLDIHGTPFSSAIKLIERFKTSEDGSRLDYELEVEDPNTFTESFEVERDWIWRPEISIGKYACEEDQQLR